MIQTHLTAFPMKQVYKMHDHWFSSEFLLNLKQKLYIRLGFELSSLFTVKISSFKSLRSERFFYISNVPYTHQGCSYLIKNTIKTVIFVIYYYNLI